MKVYVNGRFIEINDRAALVLSKKFGPDCLQWCEANDSEFFDGFICTREKGHKGPHVANGREPCAVWVDEKETK